MISCALRARWHENVFQLLYKVSVNGCFESWTQKWLLQVFKQLTLAKYKFAILCALSALSSGRRAKRAFPRVFINNTFMVTVSPLKPIRSFQRSSCHTMSSEKNFVWKWLPRQNWVAPFSGPTSTRGMKILMQCAGKILEGISEGFLKNKESFSSVFVWSKLWKLSSLE